MRLFRHTLLCAAACSLLACDADAPTSGSNSGLARAEPEFEVTPGDAAVLSDASARSDGGVELVCPRGGNTGPIQVLFACNQITVVTCKDLSNVVIELDDGSRQRAQGLKGHQNHFAAPAGRSIAGVWVKAGENHSGDGPGYGERFNAPPGSCSDAGTTPPDSGSGSDAQTSNPPPPQNPPPSEPPPAPPGGDGPGLVD